MADDFDGAWSFCSITNPNSFNDIKEILDKTIIYIDNANPL